jgi:ribokinase
VSAPRPRGVAVVGAINVDLVVVTEELPGPGETVVGERLERYGGGKGANAALAAARVGAPTALIGAVGTDEGAARALQDLTRAGVDLAGIAVHESDSTGAALIVVNRRGENQIAVAAGANARIRPEWVRAQLEQRLSQIGCVLVSTEIAPAAVQVAVRVADEAGIPCVLNTAPPIPAIAGLLRHGPILTPNAGEVRQLCEIVSATVGADVVDQARALSGRTGNAIVVTLGSDGAVAVTPEGLVERVLPPPTEVVDTTGAGDTFNGVLAASISAGEALSEAVAAAVVAGSLSVSKEGARAGMPSASEIRARRSGASDPRRAAADRPT